MIVEAREQRGSEKNTDPKTRFKAGELLAEISWSSGTKTHTQGSQLQPMNAIELRAFGVKCIELAGEMEEVQHQRKE
jgi:hypothetical protein